jgi:hypothetical protein
MASLFDCRGVTMDKVGWNNRRAHDFGQCPRCVGPCCLQVSMGHCLEDPFRCGVVCQSCCGCVAHPLNPGRIVGLDNVHHPLFHPFIHPLVRLGRWGAGDICIKVLGEHLEDSTGTLFVAHCG